MINITTNSLKALILEVIIDLGLTPNPDSKLIQDIESWIPIELKERIESIGIEILPPT